MTLMDSKAKWSTNPQECTTCLNTRDVEKRADCGTLFPITWKTSQHSAPNATRVSNE